LSGSPTCLNDSEKLQHSSIPLDDKNGFIVNTILLANLPQAIIPL